MADNVYNLKFTLSNGDVIDAGQITAPQGPKGDKGDSATIDANTLLALLLGSNGIAIAKNAAGDKVEAKLAIPETGPITFANTQVPRPAILIEVEQGGPPHAGGLRCARETSGEQTNVGPYGILISDNNGSVSISLNNDSIIEYTPSSGMPSAYMLMSGGPRGNVKTLFGNQSIYGSGNIDLYRHNINIQMDNGSTEIFINFTSSSNTAIDSLTDLFTALSGTTFIPCTGHVSGNPAYRATFPASGGINYIALSSGSATGKFWSAFSNIVITDEVTTV